MIYISASGIRDYITCSARIKYKLLYRDSLVLMHTREQRIGNLVHRVLETSPRNLQVALNLAESFYSEYALESGSQEEVQNYLQVFFDNFSHLCSEDDKIEYKFKVKLTDDAVLVGKMDRLIGLQSSIIDWKTTRRVPKSINHDIQFIVYHEAYKRIFGYEPANVYFMALIDGSTIRYKPKSVFVSTIFDEIIPNMISDIKNENYAHHGIFSYGICNKCPFVLVCEKAENVLAGSKLYNK